MFDSLADRLGGVFKKIKGQGRLDEKNVREGLREVRLALLEADVNFQVVKDFVSRIEERALGQDVLKSLTPGQQVVKIVHEELISILGGESQDLNLQGRPPTVIMMVGLQGSGKTTTSAKLSLMLRRRKHRPLLVPADVYRPAAIDQLRTLAGELSMPVFPSTPDMDPVQISRDAVKLAAEKGYDVVLLDTAGRLHVDETLMDELVRIKQDCGPREILFVADAMTGQDAVNVASTFDQRLDLSGVVLTKMEGDARGGAALSIKSVTGKPIKLIGVGEKLNDLEIFHPDRVASRILGMGDILTLIEKAQSDISEDEAAALERKIKRAQFDLEDFRNQMRRLRKLGNIEGMLKMLPGFGQFKQQMQNIKLPEKELARIEAIISSMTSEERRKPEIIDNSRKARIAKGCGRSVHDVNALLKNFKHMRQMLKKVSTQGGGSAARERRSSGDMASLKKKRLKAKRKKR